VLWLLPTAILTPVGIFQMRRFINGKASAKKLEPVGIGT
jgi:hypothetical protein